MSIQPHYHVALAALALLLGAAAADAQPANNTCGQNSAPFTIPGAGGTASGDLLTATQDGGANCGGAGLRDVYHYFTPAATSIYRFSTCTTPSTNTVLSVHAGGCPATAINTLQCSDDQNGCNLASRLDVSLQAGTLYIIRVALKVPSNTTNYTLDIAPNPFRSCCQSSNVCQGVSALDCTGTVQPAGVSCSPNPCAGACCQSNGCVLVDAAVCAGVFLGGGVSCTPSPCGACCSSTGACTVTSSALCTGSFNGPGSFCTPSPCGACCTGTACAIVASTTCAGSFGGGATTCAPMPCRACCLTGGGCSIVAMQTCAGAPGAANSTCSPPPCGACCSPEGLCTNAPASSCLTVFRGVGTTCAPDTCPVGACCSTTTGLCAARIVEFCGSGSLFRGPGASCSATNICPPAGGGFVLGWSTIDGGGAGPGSPSTGTASGQTIRAWGAIGQHDAAPPLLSGGGFTVRGGFWQIVAPATMPCGADFNGTNGVTVADIFAFLAAWFAGSPSADFNHAGGVTVADIFAFLTAWFAGCP